MEIAEAQDRYIFKTAEEQRLFTKIVQELRCGVCQNQSLSDSAAPIAIDLRNALYSQVLSGRSEKEILAFVTERYGDFALYRPPFEPATWILWFGPVLMLLIAGWMLFKKGRADT